MSGKCKKIGLGLSGLMCAGLLFSCVLTSVAGNSGERAECAHTHKQLVNKYERYEIYDDSVHDVYEIYEYECVYCSKLFEMWEKRERENHDIVDYWDSVENCWAEECGRCGYTYYYH